MKFILFIFLVLTCGAAPVAPFYTKVGTRTHSMFPTFKGGESIYVRPIAYQDLRPGMIVVVACDWTKEGCFLHRVSKVRAKWFSTKGDANYMFDPLNKPDALIGVVDEP